MFSIPNPTTPLRARMIADMSARNLGPASQTSQLRACKRFAAWLGRSPETAAPDDLRDFQRHLIESGTSICTRNQTMTGVKFLLRVTLRRHDLAAEVFSLKEPVKVPLVLSRNEVRRLLAMAPGLKARVMLSLAYGCGMRAGEVVRLKVGDIDGEKRSSASCRRRPQGSQRHAGEPAGRPDRGEAQEGQERRLIDCGVSAKAGGCGYFPRPWRCLAGGQRRPCQPRSVEGDERHRALPHGSARR